MLWRRFLVSSDGTLADLHVVLQIGFDWTKEYAVHALGRSACHNARKIKLADFWHRLMMNDDVGQFSPSYPRWTTRY